MSEKNPVADGGALQFLNDVFQTAPVSLRQHVASWGVGALIFPTTLYAGHLAMRTISLAAHSPLAPVAGVCATAVAGVAASTGYTVTFCLLNKRPAGTRLYSDQGFWHREDLAVFATSGVIVFYSRASHVDVCMNDVGFWMLGGRFRSLCPSSILHPGAFATKSLPARRFVHATPNQKVQIDAIGAISGCHSCGKRPILRNLLRRRTRYIADHQPPSKFATAKSTVRFYPHCQGCSSKQGGLWAHMWIPLGVLAIAVDDEIWQDVGGYTGNEKNTRARNDEDAGQKERPSKQWDAFYHDAVQLHRHIHELELLVHLDGDSMHGDARRHKDELRALYILRRTRER